MQPCRRHWWSALPVGSRVAFHIGASSGEDDGGPNVATGDGRAPPQGSPSSREMGWSAVVCRRTSVLDSSLLESKRQLETY